MLTTDRLSELAAELEEHGEHIVFIPNDEAEQHKKELEGFVGQELDYVAVEEFGKDVFRISKKLMKDSVLLSK